MKTQFVVWVLFAAVVVSAAQADTASPAQTLGGSGEWQSLSGGAIKGTWSVSLNQVGQRVDGSLTLEGSNEFQGGAVVGSIEGGKIVLGVLSQGAKQASFSGAIEGETVKGEWECEMLNDRGVWYGSIVRR